MAKSVKQKVTRKSKPSVVPVVKVVMSKGFEAGFMEEMFSVMASVNFDMDEKRRPEAYIR
jgi:hypothetical protein